MSCGISLVLTLEKFTNLVPEGVEGQVLEVTPTQIAIDTVDGRTLIPARFAEEQGFVVVARETQSDSGDE